MTDNVSPREGSAVTCYWCEHNDNQWTNRIYAIEGKVRHCVACHQNGHVACQACGKCLPNRARWDRTYCSSTCRVTAMKAAALQAYARQRDDRALEQWVSEIKLRAMKRIGELIRDLDKAKREGPPGKYRLASGGKSKTQAIRDAGLSVRTAARYEELAGPPEERAGKAALVAMERTAGQDILLREMSARRLPGRGESEAPRGPRREESALCGMPPILHATAGRRCVLRLGLPPESLSSEARRNARLFGCCA